MARARAAGHGPGFRTLQRAIGALQATGAHLREMYGEEFPLLEQPAKMWTRLAADWERITGENLDHARRSRKKELRYDQEQLGIIFARLDEERVVETTRGRKHKRTVREVTPLCDARIRTAVEIGAELRAGQVLRAMRSHLDLTDGLGYYRLGRFLGSAVGVRKKKGQDLDLHPELRAYLDHVLAEGYLADLERAWQRGEIEDYPLFPAGKLVSGRIRSTV